MKRDPRLRRLSWDHHHALVLARRATLAATDPDLDAGREVWDEVTTRLEEELQPHFEIEERLLLPPLERAGVKAEVRRVLDDHEALRSLARESSLPPSGCLAEFGARLTEHVRFEERVLFPLAEERLADRELEAIAAACESGPKPG